MSRKLLVLEFIFHEKKYFHTNEIRKKTYFVEIFFVSKIFDFPWFFQKCIYIVKNQVISKIFHQWVDNYLYFDLFLMEFFFHINKVWKKNMFYPEFFKLIFFEFHLLFKKSCSEVKNNPISKSFHQQIVYWLNFHLAPSKLLSCISKIFYSQSKLGVLKLPLGGVNSVPLKSFF